MYIDDQLKLAVNNQRAILFVGAGVSATLQLPAWRELIGHMAAELDFDPDVFNSLGDFYTLAEYYTMKKGIGSLRSWMDVNWHDSRIDVSKSEVHKLIVELKFPIIYTTNYDRWMEKAHDCWGVKYAKVANVGDLVKIRDEVTQIIKLHGDLEDDASLVIAESNYFARLSFEHPLDLKLRADILGRSVLFIGYSLSDINIRYLLFKLQDLWDNYKGTTARPQSYILLPRPNVVQECVFNERGVKAIVPDTSVHQEALIELLSALKSI